MLAVVLSFVTPCGFVLEKLHWCAGGWLIVMWLAIAVGIVRTLNRRYK